MTSPFRIQIVEKNDNSISNIEIFNLINQIIKVFLENDVTITEKELYFEIPDDELDDLFNSIQLINKVFKWFWIEFLSNDLKYQKFIANVNPKLKNRILNKKNFLIVRVETPLKDNLYVMELLANVNRGYPKLFINLYVEEVLNGALLFFNDYIDFHALIDEPEGLQFGKKWLRENGFDIPSDYNNLKFSEFLNPKEKVVYINLDEKSK